VTERDVMESHFDAIEAQLALCRAQLMSAREHYKRLVAQRVPAVKVEVPARCAAYDPQKCMAQGGEAANCGVSMMCRACGDVQAM
jgi:hypothetical protein